MRALILVILIGCGGARPANAPSPAVSPELSPALAPLSWWLGDWQSGTSKCPGTTGPQFSEHWLAVSGAMYGISFSALGFEVMIVDDGDGDVADGVLRFIAMPQGSTSVEFVKRDLDKQTITFVNPNQDDPKQITYAREGDQLRAVLFGKSFIKFDFCPATRQAAPELEAADRAFAADTAARGVDGWVAAFDPQGGMLRRGSRIEGPAAIRDAMSGLLAKGKLAWQPVASGREGTIGFTVGKATYTGAESWQSSYVTIWRQQGDGSWKVLFDTGRPVQKPAP
ncbi:MAG TPA: hypothetical protein VIV40_36125 [Kofleriaceae bacterium]